MASEPAPPPNTSNNFATIESEERTLPPSDERVAIRMYRGLLGDFFFVKHEIGSKNFKMLIDCGVLPRIGTDKDKPSTSLGKERIVAGVKDFIRDIRDAGGAIDLLVATHEHYDHLSGFILARDAFADIKINKVWMAWTEDPTDELANGYRSKKNNALAALAALSDNAMFAATGEMETVRNLMQFYGEPRRVQASAMSMARRAREGGVARNSSCEGVLEWLRQQAGAVNVSFLKPGDALRWGVEGAFRAYVLGPPRDDAKLRQSDPSKSGAREVYFAWGEDVLGFDGLAAIHGGGEPRLKDLPFARPYHRYYDATGGNGRRPRRAQKLYDPIVRIYEGRDRASRDRRIDLEWLSTAENLALKIDRDVNNTSLALALELTDKRALLFPGDAQVGNWLSWGDQTYPADDAKDGAKLRIDELLSRTILYKVGHHASHNATLRDRGLELMTNPDLCAMISVVEKSAREQKTRKTPEGWAMPYSELYKRLLERTGGKVVRGDGDIAEERRNFKGSMFTLSYGDEFTGGDPLWVELSLKL